MMTVAPSLASSRADSSPIPAVPPVITAVWSSSSIGLTSLGLLLGPTRHLGRHPVAEAGGVDGHFFAVFTFQGNDHAVIEHRTVIRGGNVGHHLARIASCRQSGPDEVVHALLFGSGNIDQTVDRVTGCGAGNGRGDIRGSNG